MGIWGKLFNKKQTDIKQKNFEAAQKMAMDMIKKDQEMKKTHPELFNEERKFKYCGDAASSVYYTNESRPEQTSISTDNLMTSQLVALYLYENKVAYKNMYIKRLLNLGINEEDIEKLFEFECNIIKTFDKKYLLHPQFTQMWFFVLDKPFFPQYPNKKDDILKECFLTISEICKIIDEAEWHYWNSHERELSDIVWKEIFEWRLKGAGGTFAVQYFDMIEEKIGVASESLVKLINDQGLHLSKYKW